MAVQAIGRCLKGEAHESPKRSSLRLAEGRCHAGGGLPEEGRSGANEASGFAFADGAWEPGPGGITHGAFLFVPEGSNSFFFGDRVPRVWVEAWHAKGKTQVIGQAELVPPLFRRRPGSTC